MIYIRLVVCILISMPAYLFCQQEEIPDSLKDFRGIPWYSTPDYVRENEESRYLQSFKGFGVYALSFKGRFGEYPVRIDYSFKDNELIEGSYSLDNPDNIERDFSELKKIITAGYGSADYWAISQITSSEIWIRESDYGRFMGSQLYWEFKNGFIALIAERFREKITLTVLFVTGKSISEYSTNRLYRPGA